MTPQQREQQAQTDQTLLVIHGSAEPSISAHQRDSPLLDTPYSDLPAEAHRVEEEEDSPVEEEVEAVFQVEEEVEAVSQEEEEVDSLAEEDHSLNQEIRTRETD